MGKQHRLAMGLAKVLGVRDGVEKQAIWAVAFHRGR